MNSVKLLVAALLLPSVALAEDIPIVGEVQSRCQIMADVSGIYGNPNAYTLSTTPADGGVLPIVRVDVSLANAYKARITHPDAFSESPPLNDTVTFTGSTSVSEVSDPLMSNYDTNKVTFNSTTEYDLTVAGSTWFKTSSTVTNGGNRAFPPGTYRSIVQAECIAI